MTRLPTPGPWHAARFVERPNRFIVHARLDESGEVVRTHLPDPGRLKELLLPDARVWLRPADKPRKTAWSCIYVESVEGHLVCVDTGRPNKLVEVALKDGAIDAFGGWDFVRSEATWGSSRFDFLLSKDGEPLYVEVKGVSWVDGERALFPDAVTARGTRHLNELAHLARTPGHHAGLVFVLQRDGGNRIEAARHRDPEFADALDSAAEAGVRIVGVRSNVTLTETTMGPTVPVVTSTTNNGD